MDLSSGSGLLSRPGAGLGADPVGKAAEFRQEARLREAAQGFEALFLHQMLKSGRGAGFDKELFESSATQSARAMLDGKLAEEGAGRAGLGLGEAIYRQFAGVAGLSRGAQSDAP